MIGGCPFAATDIRHLLAAIALGLLVEPAAAASAAGRNWRIDFDSLACEAGTTLVVGVRLHYLGPSGPVEAPVTQLMDGGGKTFGPRSLVWKGGSKHVAAWLPKGGIEALDSGAQARIELKFDVRGARGALDLEFGDVPAFAVTGKAGCEAALAPAAIRAPRLEHGKAVDSKLKVAIFREAYPCRRPNGSVRVVEASYPPQAARQLLVLGRGFLPSVRVVSLPTGRVAAQPYLYSGADELVPVEEAARKAIARDFPSYRAHLTEVTAKQHLVAKRQFAFNWGVQASPGGNVLYSIGLYELRSCAD